MRPVFLVMAVATAAIAVPARARADDELRAGEKGTLGIGIILGEPTGISAKLYLDDDQAIQAALGSAFVGGGLQLHADYVVHPVVLQSRPSFVLPVYIGPGVRLIDYTNGRDDSSFAIGARLVGGLLFDFQEVPLDAFVEIAAVLEYEFKDDRGGAIRLNAGAGARYYF
jgi:hypothetical protein